MVRWCLVVQGAPMRRPDGRAVREKLNPLSLHEAFRPLKDSARNAPHG